MNSGLQRLCSVSKQLSKITSRALATETSGNLERETTANGHGREHHTANTPSSIVNSLPKIHASLDECYEVGGRLTFGPDPLDRHDEKGIPKWGKWGIPLKLVTPKGSFGTTP